MWSVLRRLQGEEYEPSENQKGMRANMNHIARHECKPNPPPIANHLLTEPYGLHIYPKLAKTLECDDMSLRRKTLEAFLQTFGQGQEHVVQAIKYGIAEALVGRLQDHYAEARGLACKALKYVVATPQGLEVILSNNHVESIMAAVDDDSPVVAVEALKCLMAMDTAVGEAVGTKALIKANCIDVYIRKAREGPAEVTEHALLALSKVYDVKEAFIEVFERGAMPVFAELLRTSNSPGVLEQACDNIARLSFYSAGKRAAVELQILKDLGEVLDVKQTAVLQAATAAIMAVTIANEGKHQAVEAGLVDRIITLFESETNPVVTINILKIICNLSESPKARPKLKACTDKLKKLKETKDNDMLQRSAKRALYMVHWQSGMAPDE